MVDTLVLSRSYEPVARVTWQKAVTLLWSGKVELVEEYDDQIIRSVTLELRAPAVVRYLRGRKVFRMLSVRFSRENVLARDHGRCQYCGRGLKRPEATYDHVVPRRLGGRTSWENVVIACVPCNQQKGGRTPEQAGMALLSRPVHPKSLPAGVRVTFDGQLPDSWKSWIRDVGYWHGKLDSE